MEAAWLAAAIVVPLILNQHAFDSFQPYKSAMVRLLAAIIAAAWAIKIFLDRRVAEANCLPPRSVGIALVAFLGAQLLATLFSVNPLPSLGVADNSRGLPTSVAESVLFLAVAVFLRRPAQVDRLVAALVATSIPVALYALIQRLGFDPIAFAGSEERVFSTSGHPIFLAAYLTMVMPLTWWRIIIAATLSQHGAVDRLRVMRLLFLAGVAVLQMAGFLCAQSRGPMLGLMATATFFGLGWAAYARRRRWSLRIGAVLGFGAAFLFFLNLPLASSDRVAQALGLERFTTTLGLRGGADAFRKAHWNAGVELMTSSQPIIFPNGGGDRWTILRPWIGYGPETLVNVLPQRFLWPSSELKPESRLHDRVLDLWFTSGAIGVLAFLAFFLLVFQRGLENAGLSSGRLLFFLVPGLAIAVSALFGAIGGKGFLGLGMIVGVVAGCGLSILASIPKGPEQPDDAENAHGHRLLIIALLAALVGHLLETGFAFTVPATSLLFWLYAGMLLAPGRDEDSEEAAVIIAASRSPRRNRSSKAQTRPGVGWQEGYLAAYGPALILVTLLYAFIQMYAVDSIDWTTVLARTLTQIKGDQGPSHLIWFLFVPTWLASNFAFAGNTGERGAVRWWVPLTISAAIGVAFAIVQGAQIAGIGPLPRLTDLPATALAQISGYQTLYFTFIGLFLGLLLGAAWMLTPSAMDGLKTIWRPLGLPVLAISLGTAAAWFLALREIHTEITGTWGRALVSFGRLEAGTEVLGRAVLEKPHSIFYRRELAAAFIRRAQASRNFETFDWLSHEAEASLLPATVEAHGLSTAGADLARLYLPWAAFTPDAGPRLLLARQAATCFARQQSFAPGHPVSWLDSAVLEEFLHQPEEADRQLQTAIGLMDWRIGYWADAYRKMSLGCSAPELRQAYATVVFHLYEAALHKARVPSEIARLRLGRAMLNLGLGHLPAAGQECLEVLPSLPAGEAWQAEGALAEIDRQAHRLVEAKIHIDRAIRTAPEDQKAMLLDTRKRIEGR
ncbi:MAG: O-antigen ligase family protein [Chthoniobacter sp.]|nr:O-antigen ligase family protein [Chthoniobacter sp.]